VAKKISLYYDEGPPRVSFGSAGVFELGVPRKVDEDLAAKLKSKSLIVFKTEPEKPAAKKES